MIKQVIVIRKDLKMRRGKEIAQGAHASMAFLSHHVRGEAPLTRVAHEWLGGSFMKIVVTVNSEEELLDVYGKAKERGITAYLITDSGRTEFGGVPTNTAVAIGPDYAENLDEITGNLPLY
jgi:PTH2 family peptidyl-tRNA hydrolase